jgi:hypothetical protein
MSLRRSRIVIAAVMSVPLLIGLGVAGSSEATIPDTTAVTSVATMPDSAAETSAPSATETADVEILPPDESWAGLTRNEWEARTWQWMLSFPADLFPNFDETGQRCGYGQSGPVLFMTGGNGTCVVAEGTAIYVLMAGVICSTVLPASFGRTEDELRACAAEELDAITDFHANIDGQEVTDLVSYRIGSPLFTVTFPENNVFGVEPGAAQAVTESYAFIIAPPPPGEYEINFSRIYPDLEPELSGSTINLVVEAPHVIEPPTT